MKIATLTMLPLLVAGGLVPAERRAEALAETNRVMNRELHKRQFWDGVGASLAKNLPGMIQWGASNLSWLLKWQESPNKFHTMKPDLDQKAKKIALRYGPFSLTGSNETRAAKASIQMDPKSTLFVRTLKGVPWNAAILSARPAFTFEDGSDADFNQGIYVHHVLIADLSKPTAPFALCPNLHKEDNMVEWTIGYFLEAVGAGLVQTGNDAVGGANIYMPKKGNLKSAFLTGKDDIFGIQAEVVNYNPTNRTVYLNLELEYLEQKPANYLDASTIVISATGCKGPGYTPPQNARKYNHTSEKFDITQNGFIVNARGHLHDGGTAIELWLNEKMVCRSLPSYGTAKGSPAGAQPTILEMSWCHDSVPIRKGDSLVLKTYYDLDKYGLRPAAGAEMGSGHGHGGHGSHGGAKDSKPADGTAVFTEGLEEMGIMTTNFAWEIPADAKQPISAQQAANTQPATGSSTGSWLTSLFGSSQSASPTTAAPANASQAKDAKKEEKGWFSGLFGGSDAKADTKDAKKDTKAPAAPAAPAAKDAKKEEKGWFSNMFGGSSPSSSPSPSPLPAPAAAKKAAAPSPSPSPSPAACSWISSMFGCSEKPAAAESKPASPSPASAQPAAPAPMNHAPGGHSH